MNNNTNMYNPSYRQYDDLPIKEKAKIIKIGVSNGLRDLLSIRDKYNEFAEGGPFENQYKGGETYNDSKECAYFLNHTLNDYGYMLSGNAWTPRGVDMVYNGFDSIPVPKKFNDKSYDAYMNTAADSVYLNFHTRDTLDPNLVYTVNMFFLDSPNKEKAFNEGKLVRGTHTGYLNYDKNDDTWYVTHNIHGVIHKDRFGDLQKKGSTRVTAIMLPRKNTIANRVKTKLGFAEGGYLAKPFSYLPIPAVRYNQGGFLNYRYI